MKGKKRPVIGIAGIEHQRDKGLFVGGEFVTTGCTNVNAILRNGGLPVVLPPKPLEEHTEEMLAVCDGLLIPGGADVTPWLYGEEPTPLIGPFMPEVDRAWLAAIRCALRLGIPMLGICRGHQAVNVALGGTLYQDLSLQAKDLGTPVIQHLQKYKRTYLTHHVEVEPGSRLAAVLGVSGKLETNSMHHQSVKKVADGLKVTARACDGTIEALEDEKGLILTTQWHPEDLIDSAPIMNRLFADLVERAAGRQKTEG